MSSDDIRLPKHGDKPLDANRASLLPPGIKAIVVSDRLIFARWGLRGWSQLTPAEDRELRDRLQI